MKRKRLTVIFFSVMAFAATPYATHHFHSYVTAAQNHAQAELLQILLSYGAPENPARQAQQKVEPPATSTPPANCDAQIETKMERPLVAADSPLAAGKNKSRVRSAIRAKLKPVDFSSRERFAFDHVSNGINVRQRALVSLVPRFVALAPHLNRVSEADFLKTTDSIRMEERKAARMVNRELASLVRVGIRSTQPNALPRRAKPRKESVKPSAPEPETPAVELDNECGPRFDYSFQ